MGTGAVPAAPAATARCRCTSWAKAATFNLLYAFPLLLLGDGSGTVATLAQVFGWAFAVWGIGLYWWAGILYAYQVVVFAARDAAAEPPGSGDSRDRRGERCLRPGPTRRTRTAGVERGRHPAARPHPRPVARRGLRDGRGAPSGRRVRRPGASAHGRVVACGDGVLVGVILAVAVTQTSEIATVNEQPTGADRSDRDPARGVAETQGEVAAVRAAIREEGRPRRR